LRSALSRPWNSRRDAALVYVSMARTNVHNLAAGLIASISWVGSAAAEPAEGIRPPPDTTCTPGMSGTPPNLGSKSQRADDLSDRLADSKGVVCPPAGVDPDIRIAPPGGGAIKVIPAPGTPGGDPNVQPK
jgi:hypothetical protein